MRNVNGTCTWSCAAAAAVVRAGAAPGLLAEGSKRYYMSVKRPSDGTKDSDFDCAKRFRLWGSVSACDGVRAGEASTDQRRHRRTARRWCVNWSA